MHFEFLVEDRSGKQMLETLVPKIIASEDSFRVVAYKGVGRIPKDLKTTGDVQKRILLDQLPRLLQGYGKAFAQNYSAAVIVVCDLDDKILSTFLHELDAVLHACAPKPETRFCVAIEEGEAWLLGDIQAIKSAYPRAKDAVLSTYANDSICGTWELLANALVDGGAAKLSSRGWWAIGEAKSEWARKICPYMNVGQNNSYSFKYFRSTLKQLAQTSSTQPIISR
jgi:hypothetical protein